MKKRCPGCGKRKLLKEFHKCRTNADGHQGSCKFCCRLRRLARADEEQARRRELRAENPDKTRAERVKYANPVAQQIRNAKFRVNNKEHCLTMTREWKKENHQAVLTHNANRRARLMKAEGRFTAAEWRDRCIEYNHCCAYCGKQKKLTRHHVVPLSRGGSNKIENVVPACGRCNGSIGTKTIYPEKYDARKARSR